MSLTTMENPTDCLAGLCYDNNVIVETFDDLNINDDNL